MMFVGRSEDGERMEIMELKGIVIGSLSHGLCKICSYREFLLGNLPMQDFQKLA